VENSADAHAWLQDDEPRQHQRQPRQQEQIEQEKADARDGQAMKREVPYQSHGYLAVFSLLASNAQISL
jgi:hypothetical protein